MRFGSENFSLYTHKLIQTLHEALNKTDPDTHEELKLEAKSLVIKRNNVSAFLAKQRLVRNKMLTAQYQNFSILKTTVKLVPHGLRKHPDYASFVMMLIFNQPKNMDDISKMLATYQAHSKETHGALATSDGAIPAGKGRQPRAD